MTFSTTLDGAASLSERMRITNGGIVGIGTNSPATSHMGATNVVLFNAYSTGSVGGDAMAEIVNGSANGLTMYIGNSNAANAYNANGGETDYTGTTNAPSGVFGLSEPTTGTGVGTSAVTNSANSGSYGLYAQSYWANSAGFYGIYCAGRAFMTGDGTWHTSDERLKKILLH